MAPTRRWLRWRSALVGHKRLEFAAGKLARVRGCPGTRFSVVLLGFGALAALLGLLAAFGIGLSDLFGRRVVLAASAVTAATAMQLFAGVATFAFALVTASEFEPGPFLWGCLSGLGMAGGITLYYLGLERSTSTLVAPIVASLAALLPYLYAVATGTPSSALAVVGAAVAVVGLVFVTGGAVSVERMRAGVKFGLLSGLAYAWAAIAFIEAADAEGWWPPVGQRVAGLIVLLPVASLMGRRRYPPPGQRVNGMLSGFVTAFVSVLYLASLGFNPAVGSVALSTFPVFSVLIGRVFFADALQRSQMVGIALVVGGMAALSLG